MVEDGYTVVVDEDTVGEDYMRVEKVVCATQHYSLKGSTVGRANKGKELDSQIKVFHGEPHVFQLLSSFEVDFSWMKIPHQLP